MTPLLFRQLSRALVLGISLSSILLALMLMAMLTRYSKDVNKVIATWEYIERMLVIGIVGIAACFSQRKPART